jgi:hypothetical protein
MAVALIDLVPDYGLPRTPPRSIQEFVVRPFYRLCTSCLLRTESVGILSIRELLC